MVEHVRVQVATPAMASAMVGVSSLASHAMTTHACMAAVSTLAVDTGASVRRAGHPQTVTLTSMTAPPTPVRMGGLVLMMSMDSFACVRAGGVDSLVQRLAHVSSTFW